MHDCIYFFFILLFLLRKKTQKRIDEIFPTKNIKRNVAGAEGMKGKKE